MKPILVILAAVLVAVAGTAAAQTGSVVQLYADASGQGCSITDTGTGIVEVHMVLVGATEVGAVEFGAPKPACWSNATWIGDNIAWTLHLGDTQLNDQSGISIAFLADVDCADSNSPIYLGSMVFQSQGTPPTCCLYPVVKAADLHPEFDGPIATRCSDEHRLFGVDAGRVWINADDTCGCGAQIPLPVHETNWGRVKALY